jgi:hypothetical protein
VRISNISIKRELAIKQKKKKRNATREHPSSTGHIPSDKAALANV